MPKLVSLTEMWWVSYRDHEDLHRVLCEIDARHINDVVQSVLKDNKKKKDASGPKTQLDLSGLLARDAGTLSRILKGKIALSLVDIQSLAEVLGLQAPAFILAPHIRVRLTTLHLVHPHVTDVEADAYARYSSSYPKGDGDPLDDHCVQIARAAFPTESSPMSVTEAIQKVADQLEPKLRVIVLECVMNPKKRSGSGM